jgi:hypothetical protein
MPDMSLTEAAEWAGKQRSTIFKAIKQGRLSAGKDEKGQFRIDPSELARVFAPASAGNVAGNRAGEQADTEEKVSSLRREITLLREWLTDARSERDRLAEILQTQTRLLTSGREKQPEKPPSPPPWWQLWRRLTAPNGS